MSSKRILMIAGPNGAGKTTMTLELIQGCSLLYEYLNADEIARGLAPKHPESVALAASKLLIQRIKFLLDAEQSFAFETTASGTNYVKHLQRAKEKGYEISLTYLWLASPEEAIQRVLERVKHGGHSIPEATIVRRYYLGVKNIIIHYLPLVDEAFVFENSSRSSTKRCIAIKQGNSGMSILDAEVWQKMKEIASE